MPDIFPKRNLGPAENWGREIEGRTARSESRLDTTSDKVGRLESTSTDLRNRMAKLEPRVPDRYFATLANPNGVNVPANEWTPVIGFYAYGSGYPASSSSAMISGVAVELRLVMMYRGTVLGGTIDSPLTDTSEHRLLTWTGASTQSVDGPITVQLEVWSATPLSTIPGLAMSGWIEFYDTNREPPIALPLDLTGNSSGSSSVLVNAVE